ncbi:hypothetical protein INT45_008444 [Circinella minor]|uniref:Uncharacterized protein n=1 Tax=Circinella minor TaxID=1195481 RepID=A0A8H7SCV3_9FUNG|nr:hypothetical protein INT45_008444 [Circinella minor]
MNESKPRRTYLLLPDRFVSSIVHKYRRRQRKRADSGHHTNMTNDDIDDPRRYYYEQQERNNSHKNNVFSYQNNNTSNASSRRSNNNNNESYYSNNNSNVQSSRRSSLTTSSSSDDGENNDDNASLRSACSGMTPRPTASLAAESGMSVRLQHYQVGTPVSYALNVNNDNESLSSTSSSSLAPSEPLFLSSSRPPRPLPNSSSTLSSFPHRSNSNINETNQQHQQQRREERRSSFFRRRRPRIRQDSSNPSIANSWRIRRARASIEEDQPLPDFETQVFCATCEKWVQSRIRYRLGALTWLVAFTL